MNRLLLVASILVASACGADGSANQVGPGGHGGDSIDSACDRDGDGALSPTCGGDDCDDDDASRNPAAIDACGNGRDENCSGEADEGCDCVPGDLRGCWPDGAAAASRNVGLCFDGIERCDGDGHWSACEEASLPTSEGEACDGVDQDCDGIAEAAIRNACGTCGEPREICGNGLDDDCDGVVDPAELCRFSCEGIDPGAPEPAWLACCVESPDDEQRVTTPAAHSFLCVEGGGLPSCASDARACLALEPGANCIKQCDGSGACLCGIDGATGIESDPRCGFETACAFLGCEHKQDQPCYSGPPQTLGIGICRGGQASCTDGAWGTCSGEVAPEPEICGNGLDDDCDGLIDEADGATGVRCVTGAICAAGAEELCGNGLDDDCDGAVDELCEAPAGGNQTCYRGPATTRGLGACTDGAQREENGMWGPCTGDVLPTGERCGDGIDSNCNGLGSAGQPEDGACTSDLGEEICNGLDDDGDGLVDEGVTNACGTCTGSCEAHHFDAPADCGLGDARTCSQVQALADDPEVLTVSVDKRIGDDGEYMYFMREAGTLGQFDLQARRFVWDAPFPAPDAGYYWLGGGGLAVMPDNSVWIGMNPSYSYDQHSYASDGFVEHVDRRGHVLCRSYVPGGIASLAGAPDGSVWATNGFDGVQSPATQLGYVPRRHLLKFHGTRVAPTQPDGTAWPDGFPACHLIDLAPADPNEEGIEFDVSPMDIAIDSRGILWGTGAMDAGLRFDTRTLSRTDVPGAGVPPHIAFDQRNRLLFSTGDYGALVRIAADGPYSSNLDHVTKWGPFGIKGIALDASGLVWAVYDAGFQRIDTSTGARTFYPLANTGSPLFGEDLAIDKKGRLLTGKNGCTADWDGCIGLFAWDPRTGESELTPIHPDAHGHGLQFPPDPTGTQYRQRLAGMARWTDVVDARFPASQWRRLDWEEMVPAGASVEAWVTFADSLELLDGGAALPCGPFTTPPADLTHCGGDGHRFARVEFVLRPAAGGERPQVRNIDLHWTRP